MPITPQELVLDPWAGLSHRPILNPKEGGNGSLAASWVGSRTSTDTRRLNAYIVLRTYIDNCSRLFLADNSRQREHREYGDAALMVDAILAAVLGEDLTVQVDGADADEPTPPEPDEPDVAEEVTDPPVPPEPDADALAEFTAAHAEWETATARQDWLDTWLRKERFALKIHETERNAVQLGDGVYVLSWSNAKKRVRIKIYDPGFYFPVLDQDDDDEFPSRVHLAWEYEEADDGGKVTCYVRRITFDRVLLEEAVRRGVVFANPQPTEDAEGVLRRAYEYEDDDDSDDARYVCLLTDASWEKGKLRAPAGVDSFDYRGAEYAQNADGSELRDFDLGVDFIPIIHLPNTVAGLEHFGIAALTRIAQVLDDLSSTDTDVQASSAITGAPPISFENAALSGVVQKTYGPGTAFYGGKVTIADTSNSLDALLKLVDALQSRMNVNGRVPAEVIGRVKAGDIASGVQLLLSFGPFRSLVKGMRLVRDDKNGLLFTFVQRMAIMAGARGVKAADGGALDKNAKPLDIAVKYGSYLPLDKKGEIDLLLSMVKGGLISRSTAMRLAVEAGVDIREMADELAAVESEDFEGANLLAEATADEGLARAYLHRPPAEVPAEPEALPAPGAVPPGPGGGGQPPVPIPPAPPGPPVVVPPPRA